MSFTQFEPVTITNVLTLHSQQVAAFLQSHVLSNRLPPYTPNNPLSIKDDLVPRLGKYANDKAYVTELFSIVLSAYYVQKAHKKNKDAKYDGDAHLELEAKKEILHRTIYALDRLYEAASRLMTAIGFPDSAANRYQ